MSAKHLLMNKRYFTDCVWSAQKASDDIQRGLVLLSEIEQPIVTFFGSHSVEGGAPLYKHANELAFRLGREGYAIATGGGPGIMHAANAGATRAGVPSIGVRSDALIDDEPGDNSVLTHIMLVHFLFARRFIMSIRSSALVFYPGSFGTLDEFFESVALMSAHLVDRVPVICVQSDYWMPLFAWFDEKIGQYGFTDNPKEYMSMIHVEDDLERIARLVNRSGN